MVEEMRDHRGLGGEYRFEHRQGHPTWRSAADGAGRGPSRLANGMARSRHATWCWRSGTARATRSQMLHANGVFMERKAVLDRVAHRSIRNRLIDRQPVRRCEAGHSRCWARPITNWCITARNGRSVYSFCMCPGGTVVAAASEPGRVVTNGMSQYSRNERNANAAIVVDRRAGRFFGPCARRASAFQRDRGKRSAFFAGGGTYSGARCSSSVISWLVGRRRRWGRWCRRIVPG